MASIEKAESNGVSVNFFYRRSGQRRRVLIELTKAQLADLQALIESSNKGGLEALFG